MIEVRHLSGDQYEVRVTNGNATTHQVTLNEADRIRLGGADISGDALIAESFRFLLEREPNSSILQKFDLPQRRLIVLAEYLRLHYPRQLERSRGIPPRNERSDYFKYVVFVLLPSSEVKSIQRTSCGTSRSQTNLDGHALPSAPSSRDT